MSALTQSGLPVFGASAPFLAADGRHVFRIGSSTNGLTIDGEMVFGLPALGGGGGGFFARWYYDTGIAANV